VQPVLSMTVLQHQHDDDDFIKEMLQDDDGDEYTL
jgi:hypothetical protein